MKGHEFRPLCEAIGGTYIKLAPSSNDCINIFDISRKNLDTDAEIGRLSVRDDSLLADKIARLHIYYSLLMPDMTPQERNHLDAALVEVYRRKGITYDNRSLFEADGFTYRPMPTRKDMLEVLSENSDAKNLALVESRFVTGSAKRLGQATNVELDNQFVVIDTSEIGKDLLAAGTFTATDFCTEKCKESRVKKKALIGGWPHRVVKGSQQEQRGFLLLDGEGDSCIWQYQSDYKQQQRLLPLHKEFPAFEGNTCFFWQE